MKRVFWKYATIVALASLTGLSACNKKDSEPTIPEDAYVQDGNDLQSEFDDLESFSIDATLQAEAAAKPSDESATARANGVVRGCNCTINIDSSRKKITIDFGTQGVQCQDGRIRKGKIIITYTGPYMEPSSVITTTPENYFVSNRRGIGFVQIVGTRTVTNITEQGGNPTHRLQEDGKLIFPSGLEATWESNRVREWVSGYEGIEERRNPFDDVFKITGEWSGTDRRKQSYSAEILEALTINTECFLSQNYLPVSGVLRMEGPRAIHVINYGNGECDNTITVTITRK
ncbi:hypothetical protein FHS56_002229 [Thermonema lapsum]|uniref:Lipoprotein n=1 Tax=Thermonema lapsum TaxID=28195 RepID=A0A846MTZ3_9BACT|nr:hypothetical protein [Thermonema lapsum]NIK74697.1 hypothetical protein [Thermonema lapsum]